MEMVLGVPWVAEAKRTAIHSVISTIFRIRAHGLRLADGDQADLYRKCDVSRRSRNVTKHQCVTNGQSARTGRCREAFWLAAAIL